MRVFLEELCRELNGVIAEDTPAFTPNGPFKKAAGKNVSGQWLTINLLNDDTLILREAKLNKAGNRLIFNFTSPTTGYEAVEMALEVAETHLSDFKEYVMMALDTEAYLSEVILTAKANKLRTDRMYQEAIAAEDAARHSKNLLWGSW